MAEPWLDFVRQLSASGPRPSSSNDPAYRITIDASNPPINLSLPTLNQEFLEQSNVHVIRPTDTVPNTTWVTTNLLSGDFSYVGGYPTRAYSDVSESNVGFGIEFSKPASGYIRLNGFVTINSGALTSGQFRVRAYEASTGLTPVDLTASGAFSGVVLPITDDTTSIYFLGYSNDLSWTLSAYEAFECDASGTVLDDTDLLPAMVLTGYPDAVNDPLNQSTPIEHVLFTPGNYRGRISNTLYGNLGYLAPKSGGTLSNPVTYYALTDIDLDDPDLSYDLNDLPGPWDRTPYQQVLLDSVYCVGSTTYSYGANESDYMRFIGFDVGGRDKGSQFYGHATGCVFKRMRFKNIGISAVVQPIKFAQAGSDYTIDSSPKGNTVSECLIERYPPFTDQDCIGIQVEKYAINNTIEYCTILNYTDAVQTLYRSNDDQGLCEGLKISNCFSGFTQEVRTNEDAENILGCEQSGWDFKVGGVDGNPVYCVGNTVFGGRPNSSSIGDAISPHFCAAYLTFENNRFIDNECVVTLNVCYGPAVTITGGGGTGAQANAVIVGGEVVAVNMAAGALGTGYTTAPTISFPGPGTGATATATINGSGQVTAITVTSGGSGYVMIAPNTVFNNNLFSGIKSHGAGIWAGREGQIRQLNNTATFTNNVIVDCDEWADRDTGATEELVQPSVTTGNVVYGTIAFGDQFADQAEWEGAGNSVLSATIVNVTVGIPFTTKTLTFAKKV
jgi:hypothetical protein